MSESKCAPTLVQTIDVIIDCAQCWAYDEDGPNEWREEWKPALALIEVAPELLEACKAMMESDGLIGNQPSVLKAYRMMQEAVAKAEAR
jgi:uncharacterized Fe-S cluster-containing radical SAM superfamily protein